MDSLRGQNGSMHTSQTPSGRGLRRYFELVARGTDVAAFAFLLLLLMVVFTMILARSVFNMGLAWLDDLARYLQIWVVYTAAITVTMKGEHITMDALYTRLPLSGRRMVRQITGLASLCICALTCYLALQQAIEIACLGEVSACGVFPAIIGYASLPFGFGLMVGASIYYLLYVSRHGNAVS